MNYIVKLFSKRKYAHKLLAQLKAIEGIKLQYFDVDTPEGLAEAAFNEITKYPAVVVFDGRRERSRFEGIDSLSEEILSSITDAKSGIN